MRFSYSSVSMFNQCPYRWKLRYVDKLKTIPDPISWNWFA